MAQQPTSFYVIGVNYKKADADTRGVFTIPDKAQTLLLQDAKFNNNISALVILSTCNRTEIYSVCKDPKVLVALLCKYSQGTLADFSKIGFTLKDNIAVTHLFKVGTGMDSQILGDFEIISQLRAAFKKAKQFKMLNAYTERLANTVIQASKRIKTETQLSTGATSVSFAAVQYILAHVPHVSQKKILLFGLGKIGRHTCENLVKHTRHKTLTLINRTHKKAEDLGGKLNLDVKPYSDIQVEISKSDVLIVATGATTPTVSQELLALKKDLLILDLSVPRNVAPEVTKNPHVTLVHLDALSQITQATLASREAEIPKAEAIITELKNEFLNWLQSRTHVHTLQQFKAKLQKIKQEEIQFQSKKIADFNHAHAEAISDRIIQKITKDVARHLKSSNGEASKSIAILQDIFNLENPSDE